MIRLIVFLFVAFGLGSPASADILVFGDLTTEVYGLVQSETETTIKFLVYDESSRQLKTETFNRAAIAQVIRTIDQGRLQKLSPQRLAEYRDFAEELATIPRDQFARDCALRLIFICLDQADRSSAHRVIQTSAARNLASLAGSQRELQKFRALAARYVTDLSPPFNSKPTIDRQSSKQMMLGIVQSLRRGQFESAAQVIATPQGTAACDAWCQSTQGNCTTDTLLDAARRQTLSSEVLTDLIAMEIEIRFGAGERPKATANKIHEWQHQQRAKPIHLRWLPRVVDVAPFDLRKTVFRDGQWQESESESTASKK